MLAESRYNQSAGNGAAAGAYQENSVKIRSSLKDIAGEYRQENHHWKSQQRHCKGEDDQRFHSSLFADKAEALLHAGEDGFRGLRRHKLRPYKQQRSNGRDE